MSLLNKREYYKPFDYPDAYNFWETQQTSFWVHHEINMDQDIYDWEFNLTDSERLIIGNILKSFVQSEVLIGDYWRKLAAIFQHPEIGMMCSAFGAMESNHIAAYAYLNDTLGLIDFKGFLQDKIAMERLKLLSNPPQEFEDTLDVDYTDWRRKLAVSLAVFSAFGEGVALFSAFTVLLSFAQRGLMRGLGEIIEMSIRDESLHSKGGMWLFRQFMQENQDIKGIKKYLYEACELTIATEDKFIDTVFSGSSLPNCTPADLRQFIRQRANAQLRSINLRAIFKIDKAAIKRLNWFNLASVSDQHTDFFSGRVTNYARTDGWSDLWRDI